jgi:hypothetical protein
MTPNLKPTCPGCGEDIEDTDDIHEDEGRTWHLECWHFHTDVNDPQEEVEDDD